MAKASFRATVSLKMGSTQIELRGIGITLTQMVRADADPQPNDVSVTARSIVANNKCAILWYPPAHQPKYQTLFEDAKKDKSVFELFEIVLEVEGQGKEGLNCKGTKVVHVSKHHNGEQLVQLEMKSVIPKRF
jgi:hypothetical protein